MRSTVHFTVRNTCAGRLSRRLRLTYQPQRSSWRTDGIGKQRVYICSVCGGRAGHLRWLVRCASVLRTQRWPVGFVPLLATNNTRLPAADRLVLFFLESSTERSAGSICVHTVCCEAHAQSYDVADLIRAMDEQHKWLLLVTTNGKLSWLVHVDSECSRRFAGTDRLSEWVSESLAADNRTLRAAAKVTTCS